MTDNFALLAQPRRPWLDADALKPKFLALAATVHPDRQHNANAAEKKIATDRYADLNAAYICLSNTKERLAHLLQLELGAKPDDVQKIPSVAMDLFMEIGATLRDVDVFLGQKAQITSPLIKVQMFEKAMEWTERLNQLQRRLNTAVDDLANDLRAMNAAWDDAPSDRAIRASFLPLTRLEEIYRAISFITRWTDQVQQRIVYLSV